MIIFMKNDIPSQILFSESGMLPQILFCGKIIYFVIKLNFTNNCFKTYCNKLTTNNFCDKKSSTTKYSFLIKN